MHNEQTAENTLAPAVTVNRRRLFRLRPARRRILVDSRASTQRAPSGVACASNGAWVFR